MSQKDSEAGDTAHKTVDVLVLGGGTGNKVASAAAAAGLETVLVEKGPLGGTCLNRGCNPSKMLIAHANRVNAVADADRFHVDATLDGVDVPAIVEEVHGTLGDIADGMAESKRNEENLTLVNAEGQFVDDRTLRADGTEYTAEKVLVAAGTRPLVIDAIDGLTDVDYLTSSEALRLSEPPERLVVMGGGYIAAELGYYFDALGTEVALIEMEDSLLPREDDEVAERFTDIARRRHDVFTGYRVTSVSEADGTITATAESADGDTIEVSGDELLVALGRRPNTDRIGIENTDIALDDRGARCSTGREAPSRSRTGSPRSSASTRWSSPAGWRARSRSTTARCTSRTCTRRRRSTRSAPATRSSPAASPRGCGAAPSPRRSGGRRRRRRCNAPPTATSR